MRSPAEQLANRENGRKGGLVKSQRKTRAWRRNARRPRRFQIGSRRHVGGLRRRDFGLGYDPLRDRQGVVAIGRALEPALGCGEIFGVPLSP